jgi:hypothetical protein
MPRYDVICPTGHEAEIVAKWDERDIACQTCGLPTERIWRIAPKAIPDEYTTPYWDENLGHEPVLIYSRSQRRQLMKERGLMEAVRHVGLQGSDKSPHTTRWI